MQILIDADGCPVVDITLRVAAKRQLPCLILCDTAHQFQRPGAETVTVAKGADSVDFALVNRVKPGDVVITQDYGLAAMCLAKAALVLDQNGMQYTAANIDALLHTRHTARQLRRAGGRMKGPAKRTLQQDADFERALDSLLRQTAAHNDTNTQEV